MSELDDALAFDPFLYEKICADKLQWQGTIFSAHSLEVELADGKRAYREIVHHRGGAGVVAIENDCICLVRQYRVALGRITLEIPAGKLELGENSLDCAKRELLEETGLSAARFELIATSVGSAGFTNEHTDIFFAHELSHGESCPDEGEMLRCVWLPLHDVLKAIRAGKICDAKTVIGVFAAAKGLV